ncbi:1,4-alpha-glucan branching protein [Roseiconus nitratireducens]|uniref:1,4-alpha-glucan branching enzyme n=1 Tax=Roseiconus nitratireducens TaxID=2605748 RepID=A0A5M6CZU0_9BACT|nr:alpha-amylase family glycosyl hydrolase [Roseiconus nitratireducens]KAA5540741.1 1,4-alpha-glucan branching protein [Roseiconus nitratireducens]
MSEPSLRPGLGAIPYTGGTTFRVWAPHAPWVRVAGTFNGWDPTATPLAPEGGGHWSADVPGVVVGDEYRYVIGDLNHWRVDPRALDVTHSAGNGVVWKSSYQWQVNDFDMPPWNELVVYELHAKSFPPQPVPSEQVFRALAQSLNYLRELGINAIELMPSKEFPGDDSWGYNPTHVFALEDSYGGPDALKALIDEAHRLGIAVFLDVVYQHFGGDSSGGGDLKHSLWQFDGWFQHDNGHEMGGIYFYNDWRAQTEVGSRPDYGRQEVRRFIRDNALMWLEEYRIDGLRLDKVSGIRNARCYDDVPADDPTNLGGWGWNLLRWINDEVDHRQSWKPIIAEDMQDNSRITQSTSEGGAGFDCQWDAKFHHTLRAALVTVNDQDRDVGAVAAMIGRRFNENALHRVIYTESHDEAGDLEGDADGKQRLPEHIWPGNADSWHSKKRSTLGAAVVFTSPGIPMIFQGQEMLEWIQFSGFSRMDWTKRDRFSGIVNLYQDLMHLRRNWFNNTRGLRGHHTDVFHVNPTDKVIAFRRHESDQGGPGDDVVVVLNFANRAYADYRIGFPREGTWHVRFNSDWQGYSPDFGNHHSGAAYAHPGWRDKQSFEGGVGIGPYTAIILSQ